MQSHAALAVSLVLGACADPSGYPPPPVKLAPILQPGDVLICRDHVFRLGLPTDSSTAYPMIIGYAYRSFECRLEHPLKLPKDTTWTKTKVTQY